MLHLVTNGLYGYHRDELYYLASGNHPAFGYVDFPPLTPLLAGLDALLLGNSPWMLRLVPSIVGATLVVFVALTARELGGGRGAQMLACLHGNQSAAARLQLAVPDCHVRSALVDSEPVCNGSIAAHR